MSESIQGASQPKASRIVGIDYGMARIGIALSDESKIIASSLRTMQAEKKVEATAKKLVNELTQHARQERYRIEGIVIGLPLMMSGKHGMLADEVKHFTEILQTLLPESPVTLWDERLTTVQAERSLRETNFSRKKRSKLVDNVAATIILQNYLDSRQIRRDEG